jgi:methyl-accepting chemotaxis protein
MGELVGEISAASNEQAQGIEQINKAVGEIDRDVRQNAANAEESASASEEMNAPAEQMKKFVNDPALILGGTATVVNNAPRTKAPISSKLHAHRVVAKPDKIFPMHEDENAF